MLHSKLRYILFMLCLGLLFPLIDQLIYASPLIQNSSVGNVETSVTKIVLNGNSLTTAEVVGIAKQKTQVVIADEALARVQRLLEMLLMAAKDGQKIYGLTVGVGENKDQEILGPSGGFTPKLIEGQNVLIGIFFTPIAPGLVLR